MTNRNDFDKYDKQIAEKLSDLPLSDEIVKQTTPWKTAVSQIIAGFILTSFTLSFYYLQYILPCIGILLSYLGFRTLRRENRWFRASWILSGVRILYTFYSCVFVTTKLFQLHWLSAASSVVNVLLSLSLLFTFRMALRSAFAQVNKKTDGDPLLWAMIWYAAVVVLALIPLSLGWFVFIPVVVFYILIILSLYRAGQNLDEWGYQVKAAPVFFGRKLLCILYSILILLSAGTGCVVSNRVSMKANAVDSSDVTSQQSVRDHLAALGFPEEILADILDEDLDGMGYAIRCSAESSELSFGGIPMTATTVYTESPGGMLRTVSYFKWNTAPKIVWQDAIQIKANETQSQVTGKISGRILYDKNDTSYTAPLAGLNKGNGQSTDSIASGSNNQILAKFSFPFCSSKQRGYIMYNSTFNDSLCYQYSCYIYSCLYYYHQTNPFVLPYSDVLGGFSNGKYSFPLHNYNECITAYASALEVKLYGK